MKTSRSFECDICNLSFSSQNDYLKQNITSKHKKQREYYLNKADFEVEFDDNAINKTKAKFKAKAKADTDSQSGLTDTEDTTIYSRQNNCVFCGKTFRSESLR